MSDEEQLVVYQAENGAIAFKADAIDETVWATQKQLAQVFGVDVRTISEHINNIFNTHELEEKSVVRNFRITAADGKNYNTNHYNLDMIISVGYRVNSKTATRFRKWATQTLKQHITQGYTINSSRIAKNYQQFLQAVEEVKVLARDNRHLATNHVLDLVTSFAYTWFYWNRMMKTSFPKRVSSIRHCWWKPKICMMPLPC
ncbi:MAG: RhuM family protein [Mariprofundaceae bacterium]